MPTGDSVQPQVVGTATTQNFISSGAFVSNLDQGLIDADRGEELVERFGSQNLTGLLTFMGAKTPVVSTTFYHYEEDWLHQTFKFQNTVAQGTSFTDEPVGNAYELDEADDTPDVNAKAYVREGDVIENTATGERALVTDVTASETGVVISASAFGTTNFSASASDSIVVLGNAFAERTGQPDALSPTVIEYKNYTQIMKDTATLSGSAMTERIWIEVEDENGNRQKVWTHKAEKDTYKRFMNHCETMMIVGRANDGSNGLPTATEGLEHFARSGNTYQYNAFTALDDLRAIADRLDEQRGAMENLFIQGHDLFMDYNESILTDTNFQDGAIQYGAFGGEKDIAIGFGFKSFTYAGFTFHAQKYAPFSYKKLLGAYTSKYKKAGCVIPVGDYIDPQTREITPSLRLRHKEYAGYSRDMEVFLTGSAGIADPTNDIDELNVNYRTERAFEGFGNNRFVWVESGAASAGAESFTPSLATY